MHITKLLELYGHLRIKGLGLTYQGLWDCQPYNNSARYAIRLVLLRKHSKMEG